MRPIPIEEDLIRNTDQEIYTANGKVHHKKIKENKAAVAPH